MTSGFPFVLPPGHPAPDAAPIDTKRPPPICEPHMDLGTKYRPLGATGSSGRMPPAPPRGVGAGRRR
jgi:hypothetical protein